MHKKLRQYPGPRPSLEYLEIDGLYVDTDYQRNINTPASQKLIKTIVREFSWRKFQPLTVACVEDEEGEIKYAIVDGQHQFMACLERGDINEIPCYIITADETKQQAETFTGINKNRVGISPVALYHAEIAAGYPLALLVKQSCDDACVKIAKNTNTQNMPYNETIAVGCLKALVKNKLSRPVMFRTLEMLRKAGDPDRCYLKSTFIKVIFQLTALNMKGPLFNQTRLVDTLRKKHIDEWERAFKAYRDAVGCNVVTAAKILIAKDYNKGLYSGKLKTKMGDDE